MKNLVSHRLGDEVAVVGVKNPPLRVLSSAAWIRPQDGTSLRPHDLDVTFSSRRGFSCRSGRKFPCDDIVGSNKRLEAAKRFGAQAFRVAAPAVRARRKIWALAHGVAGASSLRPALTKRSGWGWLIRRCCRILEALSGHAITCLIVSNPICRVCHAKGVLTHDTP